MKRLSVSLLLCWCLLNLFHVRKYGRDLARLKSGHSEREEFEKMLGEYLATKIQPAYPVELKAHLAKYESPLAAQHVRDVMADIDCVLITRPVFEQGIVLREITEKIILSPELPVAKLSPFYEVGHRVVETLPRTREHGKWIVFQGSGNQRFFNPAHHRIRGLADIPEEFALRELRKMAGEALSRITRP